MSEYWSYSKRISTAPLKMAGLVGTGAGIGAASAALPASVGAPAAAGGTLAVGGTTVAVGPVAATAGLGALAAAGGAAIGQGGAWLISALWDPTEAVFPVRDPRQLAPVTATELDLFLFDLAPVFGLRMDRVDSCAPAGLAPLIGACCELARAGVGLSVHLLRGAMFATAGDGRTLRVHARAAEEQMTAVARAMERVAVEAEPAGVAALLGDYTARDYRRMIDGCRTRGWRGLPESEWLYLQRLLALAGVRLDSDLRDDLAAWVAAGPHERELAAFEEAGGVLSFADLLRGSVAETWSAIRLGESPLLGPTRTRPRPRRARRSGK
jgi:hypothetical protein